MPAIPEPVTLTELVSSIADHVRSIPGVTFVEVLSSYDEDPSNQFMGVTLAGDLDVSISFSYTDGQFWIPPDEEPTS